MKQGKRLRKAIEKVEHEKLYEYSEAVGLAISLASAKFDETVDIAARLNIQQKHSIRGSISLPHPVDSGNKKVLVFAQGEKAKEATEAGATYVGAEDMIEKIRGGWLDFDVAIAVPEMMKEVGKLGPILGKRGLMPNPKVGTVTMDVKSAVKEFMQGKVEFRAEKNGIVHLKIGRISQGKEKVMENGIFLFRELMRRKPSDIKGEYVKSVYLSTTMGPGIKIDNLTIK
ncbi:MAG: 50S ribosomal protein L1 [Spirochaetae bacterium HGW-Spirochaetae-6]|nr:MAG: 50S ribosomal protein L1 [Spirochaetae bacterium HGW-Spirochaetae-6]